MHDTNPLSADGAWQLFVFIGADHWQYTKLRYPNHTIKLNARCRFCHSAYEDNEQAA
jgi:hypothetical protein